jgi:hypothetical protein
MLKTMTNFSNAILKSRPNAQRKLKAKYGFDSLVETRTPNFVTEFINAKQWPAQVDRRKAKDILDSAYENARSSLLARIELIDGRETRTLERWQLHSQDEGFMEWVKDAELGSVRFPRCLLRTRYMSSIIQPFNNAPCQPQKLEYGKLHVAIGFVDFGFLLFSKYDPELLFFKNKSNPIRVLGYEASAYCVTKSLVVYDLMKMGVAEDLILQVMSSLAWTRSAFAAFKASVTNCLDLYAGCQSAEVVDILGIWQTNEVSLTQSRALWLESVSLPPIHIANFAQPADRLALCKYAITGQLVDDAEVGSLAMPGLPADRYGKLALDSDFFGVLPFGIIAPVLASATSTKTVIDVAVDLLIDGIRKLSLLIIHEHLVIDLRHRMISCEDKALHSEISSMQPWTILWTNVPDHFYPSQFFEIARACSSTGGLDTIHYFYSMNWTITTMGSSIIDYPMFVDRNMMTKLLDQSAAAIGMIYRETGLSHRLLSPPIDYALNIGDVITKTMRHGVYTKAFFKYAHMLKEQQYKESLDSFYFPLHRVNGILYYSAGQNNAHKTV